MLNGSTTEHDRRNLEPIMMIMGPKDGMNPAGISNVGAIKVSAKYTKEELQAIIAGMAAMGAGLPITDFSAEVERRKQQENVAGSNARSTDE
jgi:hypothetical protein